MKPPSSPAARRALGLYGGSGPRVRLHTTLRWWSAPFAALELEVPLEGDILELGCGHGLLSLYLAVSSRARRVVGVDIDPEKIDAARAAAGRLLPHEANVAFATVEPGDVPTVDGGWRAIVIADVVYLLDAVSRRKLLEACADALAPGGLLVVKEVDTRPAWKARLAQAQEVVATRVVHITAGDTLDFPSRDEVEQVVAGAGLRAQAKRIDHGYLHPHFVVLGTRTAGV